MSSRRPDGFFPRRGRGGRGFFPRRGNFNPRGRKNYNPDLRQANRDYKRKFYDDDYKYHSRSRSRYSRSPSYHRHHRSRSRSYSRSPSSRSRSRTPKRYRRSSSPRYDRSRSKSPAKYQRHSPSPRSSKPVEETPLDNPKSGAPPSLYDADVPLKPEGFKNKFVPIGETAKNVSKGHNKEEATSKSKDIPIYSDEDSNDNNNKDDDSKSFLRNLDENKDIRTILLERAMLEKKKLGLDNPGTSEKSSALEALRCYSPEPRSPVHEKTTKKSILKNRNSANESNQEKKQLGRPPLTVDRGWNLRGTEKKPLTDDWSGLLPTEKTDTGWQTKEMEKKKVPTGGWSFGASEKKPPFDDWDLKQKEKLPVADSWDLKSFERKAPVVKDKDASPVLPTIPGLGFSSVDDEDAFLYGEENVEEKKPLEMKPKADFDEQQNSRGHQAKIQKQSRKERSSWSDDEVDSLPYRRQKSRTPSPLYTSTRSAKKPPSHSSWDRNDTIDLQLSIGKSKLFSDDLLRVNRPSPSLSHKSPPFTTKLGSDWENDSPPPKCYLPRRHSPDLTDDLMVTPRDVFDEGPRRIVSPRRESYQMHDSPQERFQDRGRDVWSDSPPRRSPTSERAANYREKRESSPFFGNDVPYSPNRKRYRPQSPYEDSYRSKRDWSPYSNSPYRSPPLERMEASLFRERHGRYSPSPPPRGRYGSPGRNRSRYYNSPVVRKRRSVSPGESSSPSPRHRHRERYESPLRSGRRRRYSSSPSPVRESHEHQMSEQHHPLLSHLPQSLPGSQQQLPSMQQFFNANPPVVYQDPSFVQQFQAPPAQQPPFYPASQFPVPAFPPPTPINFSVPPPNFSQPPPAPQGIFAQLSRTNLKVIPLQNDPLPPPSVDSPSQVKEAAPSPVRHHFVPLTPVAEPPKLSDGQRRHLICLCEEKKSRLVALSEDLEHLQKVQGEMMRKKQRQKDGHKDPMILENAKKQELLTRQINEINSTVAEAERRLGFVVSPKPAPSSPKNVVLTTKSTKKAKKEKEKEDDDHGSISRFEYFDPGSHWCEQCNDAFPNIRAILEHFQDPAHKEARALL